MVEGVELPLEGGGPVEVLAGDGGLEVAFEDGAHGSGVRQTVDGRGRADVGAAELGGQEFPPDLP